MQFRASLSSLLRRHQSLVRRIKVDPIDLNDLRRSDPEAWDHAYPVLWGVAMEVAGQNFPTGSLQDHEDLSIRTIEKVRQRLPDCPGIDNKEKLRAFTATVAKGEAIDHLRSVLTKKRGTGKVDSLENYSETSAKVLDEQIPQPDAAMMGRELAELVSELFLKLKPMNSEILYRAFILKQTHAEIAKATGLARGSIGEYVKRALDAARASIQKRTGLKGLRSFAALPAFILFLLRP